MTDRTVFYAEVSDFYVLARKGNDEQAAAKIYQLANEDNIQLAAAFWILITFQGSGVPVDKAKASEIGLQCLPWLESVVCDFCDNSSLSIDPDAIPYAAFVLGMMHYWAIAVVQDLNRHVKLLSTAVSFDYSPAMNALGACYFYGDSVKKDWFTANTYFRQAAAKGNAQAMCNLAESYYYGSGIVKSRDEARIWYEKAVNNGLLSAQYPLALCYLSVDETKAMFWATKAAERNHADAQYFLASCLYEGRSLPKEDNVLGTMWMQKASQNGHLEAKLRLAAYMTRGTKGLPKDPTEAVALVKIVLDANKKDRVYYEACFMYGSYCIHGYDITEPDEAEGLLWLNKAIKTSVCNIDSPYLFIEHIGPKLIQVACKHSSYGLIKVLIELRANARMLTGLVELKNCFQVMFELGMYGASTKLMPKLDILPVDLRAELDQHIDRLDDALPRMKNEFVSSFLTDLRTIFAYGFQVRLSVLVCDVLKRLLVETIASHDKKVSKTGLDVALAMAENDNVMITQSSDLYVFLRFVQRSEEDSLQFGNRI